MFINSHFEGEIHRSILIFVKLCFLAGHGSEGCMNRRLNFYNTTTKLSIPHEFIQRTIMPAKRITSLVAPGVSQKLETSSSIESGTSIGRQLQRNPFV